MLFQGRWGGIKQRWSGVTWHVKNVVFLNFKFWYIKKIMVHHDQLFTIWNNTRIFLKLLNILYKLSFPTVWAFYLILYSIINMTSSGEYFFLWHLKWNLLKEYSVLKKKSLRYNNIIKGFNIIKDATSKLIEISW